MRDGEGGDYFKANAIREKCTVGKCSGRAPFILTLCACGVGDATSVSMTEEELCSSVRGGKERGAATRPSVGAAHSKGAGVFSRLVQSVLRRMRQESLPSFPPPPPFLLSSIHDSPRLAARLPGRASERAPTRLSALSPSLSPRDATLGTPGGGGGGDGRAAAEWQAVWFSRLGGMMMMHRLLPTDGRTDG